MIENQELKQTADAIEQGEPEQTMDEAWKGHTGPSNTDKVVTSIFAPRELPVTSLSRSQQPWPATPRTKLSILIPFLAHNGYYRRPVLDTSQHAHRRLTRDKIDS